jgi:hypothetical protein
MVALIALLVMLVAGCVDSTEDERVCEHATVGQDETAVEFCICRTHASFCQGVWSGAQEGKACCVDLGDGDLFRGVCREGTCLIE